MNTLEILQSARDLLSDPSHWIQGSMAQDVNGRPTIPMSPKAVCWCLVGAICNANQGTAKEVNALRLVRGAILRTDPTFHYTDTIGDWNDAEGRKHSEVLAVLDSSLEGVIE